MRAAVFPFGCGQLLVLLPCCKLRGLPVAPDGPSSTGASPLALRRSLRETQAQCQAPLTQVPRTSPQPPLIPGSHTPCWFLAVSLISGFLNRLALAGLLCLSDPTPLGSSSPMVQPWSLAPMSQCHQSAWDPLLTQFPFPDLSGHPGSVADQLWYALTGLGILSQGQET